MGCSRRSTSKVQRPNKRMDTLFQWNTSRVLTWSWDVHKENRTERSSHIPLLVVSVNTHHSQHETTMWKSVGVPRTWKPERKKTQVKTPVTIHACVQSEWEERFRDGDHFAAHRCLRRGQTVALRQTSPVFSLRHTKCVTCIRNWCQVVSTRFFCFPKKSLEMSACRFFLSCSSFRDLIMSHSTEVPVVCLRIPSSIQKLHMFLQHGIMVFSSVSPFKFDFWKLCPRDVLLLSSSSPMLCERHDDGKKARVCGSRLSYITSLSCESRSRALTAMWTDLFPGVLLSFHRLGFFPILHSRCKIEPLRAIATTSGDDSVTGNQQGQPCVDTTLSTLVCQGSSFNDKQFDHIVTSSEAFHISAI